MLLVMPHVDHHACDTQAAKEHITRPLDSAEVQLIDRAMLAFRQDYQKQRRLEDLHGLPSSRKDCRTVATNQWRLLTLIPQLGLQVSPRTFPVRVWGGGLHVRGGGL